MLHPWENLLVPSGLGHFIVLLGVWCLPLKMFLRDWDLSNVLFSYFWEVLIIIMIVHILVTQEIYLFDFFFSLQLRQQRKWFAAPVALGHE